MLIFWDIDGTLMHCGSDGTKALNETFKKLYDIDDAFHKVGIGRAMDSAILDKIMVQFEIPKDQLTIIKTTFMDVLYHILIADDNKRVLPGIRELLYFAEREGHVNSLLTSNIRVGAETKLRSVSLNGHFTGGGFGDEVGEKWDIATLAHKEIEIITGKSFDTDQVIVVGDSVYDIKTAREKGYNVISVATGWTESDVLKQADPDVLFDNFGDTQAVMDVIKAMSKGV